MRTYFTALTAKRPSEERKLKCQRERDEFGIDKGNVGIVVIRKKGW
jgi:hypothetical protein